MAQHLLTTTQFGDSLRPPKSRQYILELLKQGRVQGAQKIGGIWLIPKDARIKGTGRRIEDNRRLSGISVGEYAARNGVVRQRVYQLLWEDKIEGAVKTEWGWDIPRDAPWPTNDGF